MAEAERVPKAYVAVSAVSLLLLGWLYGGDVSDALKARTAEVAAFAEPPSLAFAVVVLLAALSGASVTALGVVKRKGGGWRGYRLMPIVTVVVLFVDLFFVFGSKSPLSTADRSLAVIQVLTNQANLLATPSRVPSVEQLEEQLAPFEPPAYQVKGERPRRWVLKEVAGCSGPVAEPRGEPVGTLFYCVSPDLKQAWLSLVGLDVGRRFGTPEVMKRGSEVVAGVVAVPVPDEPGEDMEPPPGAWLDPGDAGASPTPQEPLQP